MRRQIIRVAAAGVWFLAVATGFVMLLEYKSTPGSRGETPSDWPRASRLIRADGQASLVVVLHPRCPCSSATVEQLDRILTQAPHAARTHILLCRPTGAPMDWCDTPVGRRVMSLPAVQVLADTGGVEARLFGVETSGHVLLFHGDGRLLFSGGITGSRGHAGDNSAGDALLALLTGESRDRVRTPVYGCPLGNDDGAVKGNEP